MTGSVDLPRRVLGFCRLLRDSGFRITPSHTTAALQALGLIDVGDRTDFELALRSVLVSGEGELEPFGRLFELFWEGRLALVEQEPDRVEAQLAVAPADAQTAYSALEVLASKDFADFTEAEDRAELERLLLRLAAKLATRRNRRYQPVRHGGAMDLRRTVRRSLRLGGTAVELARRRREVAKTRLVLICDVSRSMDQYSRFLLQFIYGFQRALRRVESFVFGTRLTRVTRYFRTSGIQQALEHIAAEVLDWSGGTRMGASLAAFNRDFRGVVDSSTVVVILSDGLDTGDASLLAQEMALLRRRARKLVWLNPLLGSRPGEPLGRGMRAALPYIDSLAPANNLRSLEAFVRTLV
jgi:uncharacterized protein with von Willebrand factor type A (vWA) domain